MRSREDSSTAHVFSPMVQSLARLARHHAIASRQSVSQQAPSGQVLSAGARSLRRVRRRERRHRGNAAPSTAGFPTLGPGPQSTTYPAFERRGEGPLIQNNSSFGVPPDDIDGRAWGWGSLGLPRGRPGARPGRPKWFPGNALAPAWRPCVTLERRRRQDRRIQSWAALASLGLCIASEPRVQAPDSSSDPRPTIQPASRPRASGTGSGPRASLRPPEDSLGEGAD